MDKTPPPGSSGQEWIENVKEYTRLRFDLLKINMVEKSSSVLSLLIGFIIGALLLFAAMIFLSFALIYGLGSLLGSLFAAFLIWSGLFVALFIVFYFFKEKWVLNPLIRKMSELFLEDPARKEEEHDAE